MNEGSKPFYSPRNANKQIRTMINLHLDTNEGEDNPRQSLQSYKSSKLADNNYAQLNFQRNRKKSLSPLNSSFDKQLHSIRNRSRFSKRSKINDDNPRSAYDTNNEADSEKQTIKVCHDRLSRYENIVSLTEEENENLKQQNKYLLQKLRKMQQRQQKIKKLYLKAKNYKAGWIDLTNQIKFVRSLLHDFKQIALVDIPVLKQKVNRTEYQSENTHTELPSRYSITKIRSPSSSPSTFRKTESPQRNFNEYDCIQQDPDEADQKTFGSLIDTLTKIQKQDEQETGRQK